MWDLKNKTNKTKHNPDSYRKQIGDYQREGVGRGMEMAKRIKRSKLPIIKELVRM